MNTGQPLSQEREHRASVTRLFYQEKNHVRGCGSKIIEIPRANFRD